MKSTDLLLVLGEKGLLNKEIIEGSIPFLCPGHIRGGVIKWPSMGTKYNSIIPDIDNVGRLRPVGNYVLVKRTSSKEEKRRIVCGVVQGSKFDTKLLAFDNKTNYFHRNKDGIELGLAIGLSIYLSSSIIDMYFRIFSGHTQVNAADLRGIKYPSRDTLDELGRHGVDVLSSQQSIDEIVKRIVFRGE